jgi:hypothetical protein
MNNIIMDLSMNNTDTNDLNSVYDVSQNQQALMESRKKAFEKIITERKKELVQILMRQTEYSELEAEIKLKEYDYKILDVLNNYHGYSKKNDNSETKTTNQQIYGEIRNLMDTGARNFRIEQERAKKYQDMLDKNTNTNN